MSARWDALAADMRAAYRTHVEQPAARALMPPGDGPLARAVRSAVAPIAYTLDRRTNFFRSDLCLRGAAVVGEPAVGVTTAVAVELGWCVALALDDAVDGSLEREGHPSAVVVCGRARTLAAIPVTLLLIARCIASAPLALAARVRLLAVGTVVTVLCALSQLPRVSDFSTHAGFERQARWANIATHWSVAAAFVAAGRWRQARAAWRFADTLSVLAKIRNDLCDVVGGSTESVALHKDLAARKPSFVMLTLLDSDLPLRDRDRVRRHFDGEPGAPLTPPEFVALLRANGVVTRGMDRIDVLGRRAHAQLALVAAGDPSVAEFVEALHEWVDFAVEATREQVVRWLEEERT